MSEKLTIDRADWLTGTALSKLSGGTLCDSLSKQMCCLGFYGINCGLTKTQMEGTAVLTALKGSQRPVGFEAPGWLYKKLDEKDAVRFKSGGGTAMSVESALAEVNDNALHPIRKESAIAYLFKKYGGIDVNFVGRYADGTARARRAKRDAD